MEKQNEIKTSNSNITSNNKKMKNSLKNAKNKNKNYNHKKKQQQKYDGKRTLFAVIMKTKMRCKLVWNIHLIFLILRLY